MRIARYMLPGIVITGCFVVTSCAQKIKQDSAFVACTPCDREIRGINGIPPDADCDLVKWKLTFYEHSGFHLENEWGFYINNWTYEKRGQMNTEGKYEFFSTTAHGLKTMAYRLNPDNHEGPVLLLKLNDNLIHIMDERQNLLIGNGGWSYTLNNNNPRSYPESPLPHDRSSHTVYGLDSAIVFEGRTPCLELADKLRLPKDGSCLKLKWRLKLYVDTSTGAPATYELERTFHRQSVIKGKWIITKGAPGYPEAMVYELDPDKPEQSLLLMKGDDNVLFFLDEYRNLLTGNNEFSYTLNRR